MASSASKVKPLFGLGEGRGFEGHHRLYRSVLGHGKSVGARKGSRRSARRRGCSKAAFDGRWRDRATAVQDEFAAAIGEAGIRSAYSGAYLSKGGDQHAYAHYTDLVI